MKQYLDKVPGTIIVILDSCFSGKFIGKGDTALTREFNRQVIDVFASGSAKGLETNNKYHVITASAGDKVSFYVTKHESDVGFSYMTYFLSAGIGFDLLEKSYDELAADADKDRNVTMAELFNYAYPRVRELPPFEGYLPQEIQRFPENDNLVIAGWS